jgi:hypothetical protein
LHIQVRAEKIAAPEGVFPASFDQR